MCRLDSLLNRCDFTMPSHLALLSVGYMDVKRRIKGDPDPHSCSFYFQAVKVPITKSSGIGRRNIFIRFL